ncbi:MAG: glycosyltransferase family 4 protein [Pseudarcicella sp.]|nr:glycosyltransferase family 4 protein [Pseudarcicella sp.]MBP6410510.1 glycosyltransferase family 4 protein [Pseudarcicella sp.]
MQKKKILILHNILWAHYKSVLFQEIDKICPPDLEILVLQIAKNEIGRKSMETSIKNEWQYSFHLLFDDYIENIPLLAKIKATLKFIIQYKPDVINITGYGVDPVMPIVIIWAKLNNVKLVISSESTSFDAGKSFLKEKFKSFLVDSAKGFITFGSLSKQYLIELGANTDAFFVDNAAVVDDRKIKQIFDQAKANKFEVRDLKTKHNFVYVGRFSPEKNLSLLLENFKKVKVNCPEASDWGLLMIGDGTEKAMIQSYVTENQLNDVVFVPSIPWYEVPQYFTVSDCLLLTSNSEAWGLVVNEAMICGLPAIVSSQCGCAPDLIKSNGFVFDLKDPNSLFQAMLSMVKLSPEKRIDAQFKSLEIVKKFNVNAVANRIIECFHKI